MSGKVVSAVLKFFQVLFVFKLQGVLEPFICSCAR